MPIRQRPQTRCSGGYHRSSYSLLKFSSESKLFDEEDKTEEESARQVELGAKLVESLLRKVFIDKHVDSEDLALHARVSGFLIQEIFRAFNQEMCGILEG